MLKNKVVREIFSWLMYIAIAVVLAVFIDKVIIMNVEVPSGSMEKTIMTGDKIITFRLSYMFSDPKRGDIVVFPYPDNEKVDYIKRIIGLPGETIEGREDGYVYIDGVKLEESYVAEKLDEPFGPYVIPKDSYFMMGDNRGISQDARYWENKFVKKDKIRGKALFRYPNLKWLK